MTKFVSGHVQRKFCKMLRLRAALHMRRGAKRGKCSQKGGRGADGKKTDPPKADLCVHSVYDRKIGDLKKSYLN